MNCKKNKKIERVYRSVVSELKYCQIGVVLIETDKNYDINNIWAVLCKKLTALLSLAPTIETQTLVSNK